MRVVKASFALVNPPEYLSVLKHLEAAARTCYKSEARITEDSAVAMMERLLNMGHHSVLEHTNISVRGVMDRAIGNEWVRHRVGSAYSQESSRYCVAGDMELSFANAHRAHTTLRELYRNKINSPNGAWKKTVIRQVDETTGEVIYTKILNIHYMGEKETLVARTRLGYVIKATPDHEIKTDNGYVELQDVLGKKIATNGTEKLYTNRDWLFHQYNTLAKTSVTIAREFGYTSSVIKSWVRRHNLPRKPKSYFNMGRRPWNKDLNEHDDPRVKKQATALRKYHWNGGHSHVRVPVKDRVQKLSHRTYHKMVEGHCALCGSTTNLLVHHVNEDRFDNSPSNLITVCFKCHGGVHNKTNSVVFYDEVVSLLPGDVIDVYDIEMPAPNHNFIANGVCVHNCLYSKDQFGGEITCIAPVFWKEDSPQYHRWYKAMQEAEEAYMMLVNDMGATAQEARSVLPTSLKTEIFITHNIRQWLQFFSQRCAGAAHPQMREQSLGILKAFASRYPVFFGKIFKEFAPQYALFEKNSWELAAQLPDEVHHT